MKLKRPIVKAVRNAERKLMRNPRTIDADRALNLLFERYPDNNDIAQVLPKVATLNGLYSTSIFDVVTLARAIVKSPIDRYLRKGDLRAVTCISRVRFKKHTRRCYSFATKYCSFHRPDIYPMFDQNVERALKAYRAREAFAKFADADLKHYERFVEILKAFGVRYRLRGVTVRALDKFLWKVGNSLRKPGGAKGAGRKKS